MENESSAAALPGPESSWGASAWHVALGLMAVFVTLFSLTLASSLWDRDEPRNARAAVEMVRSGDFLVPTNNEKLRSAKPPMTYWVMAGPVALMGPTSEVAVRLPSVLGMTLACFLTYRIGRRLLSPEAGWWAMVALGTAGLGLWIGSSSIHDGTMLPWFVAAIYVWVRRITGERAAWHVWAFAGALGLCWLGKGPVGPLYVLLAGLWVEGWLRWRQRNADITAEAGATAPGRLGRWWPWWLGAQVVGLLFFVGWGLPASIATDWQLAQEGLGYHIGRRLVQPLDGHGGRNWWQYLLLMRVYVPVTLALFMPWTLFLVGGSYRLIRGSLGDEVTRAVLGGLTVPVLVITALVATKLPHYTLTMYVGLALIAGAAVAQARQGLEALPEHDRRWMRRGLWLYAPSMIPLVLGLPFLGYWANGGVGVAMTLPIAVVVGVFVVLVIRHHASGQIPRAAGIALWGTLVSVVLNAAVVLPMLETRIKPSPVLAEVIRARVSAQTDVTLIGYEEGSMIYYLHQDVGHPVRFGSDDKMKVQDWLATGQGVLVVTQEKLDEAGIDDARLEAEGLEELARLDSINYSKRFMALDLRVLLRE